MKQVIESIIRIYNKKGINLEAHYYPNGVRFSIDNNRTTALILTENNELITEFVSKCEKAIEGVL